MPVLWLAVFLSLLLGVEIGDNQTMNGVTSLPTNKSFLPTLGYRASVSLAYILVVAFCMIGVANEFRHIDENATTLARERGNVLFRLVELTRDWNAMHGGVYVPVSEQAPPNPYLEHPRRDLETIDGVRLTMINPAYMTRQIAEIAEKSNGVKYHITSLNPIRPANAPDPWEAEALRIFETRSQREILSLIDQEGGAVHRFMAPLLVKEACLSCHQKQGYRIGQVRGGISVTMPAGEVLAIRQAQRERTVLTFAVAGLVIGLMMHVAIWRSRRYFLRLRELTAGQESLIVERTRELACANAQLTEEIADRGRKEELIAESEARYRSVIETSQDGILIMQAPSFELVFANERAAAILGLSPALLIGRPVLDFVFSEDRAAVVERLSQRLSGQALSSVYRCRVSDPAGSRVRVCSVHVARIDTDADVLQWVVSVQDVTDRLASERALQISSAVMESASEGIMVTDVENRIIQVNPAFTAISGYRPQEVLGKDPRILGAGRHPAEFFESMWGALASDGRWAGEVWNKRPDGTVYVAWLAISTIRNDALESGGRHLATFTDITQRKEMEELLRHKAHSDPLTNLPNRALFYDRLQMAQTQARRYDENFALLYLDLDYFKNVNDSLGHAAGDELLIEAARRLVLAVRDADTVARLGGDEFAVILPKVSMQGEVEEVAQRIVVEMAREFNLAAGTVRVSASVGIAIYPVHGEDLDLLKQRADTALYAVKQAGRNAYQVYHPTVGMKATEVPGG